MEKERIASRKAALIKKQLDFLRQILAGCQLCPRMCRVNGLNGEKGYCRSGADLVISSYNPHHGEEP